MTHTADVVIIGGGIVGASVAWHLRSLGCRDILMLERESQQGKGSTGKSMGGVRAQFATPVNIGMSLYSIPFFADFEARTGHPSGYKPHGYLFVASEERHLAVLRQNGRVQQQCGLGNAHMLSSREVLAMAPMLRPDRVLGGSFCPTDGFVDPHLVMTGFTTAAVGRGVTLWRDAAVTAIGVSGGKIDSVTTSRSEISTPVVVNAAGAWAAQVARLAGYDLPVTPLRRMLVPTEPFPGIPERCPMTIDMSSGFHFRPEGLGLLMAWNDPDETSGFKTQFEEGFVEKILTRAVDFVPAFEDLQVNPHRGWAGLYEVSPDHHAILGPAPGIDGLYFANGFSGHGVMHSPATGCVVAEWIVHGRPRTIDVAAELAPTRFAEGKAIHETAVL